MIRVLLVVLLSITACDAKAPLGDSQAPLTGLPDDPDTACNEANEACEPGVCGGEGPTMLPGSNCLACHNAETGADDAPPYTAAGTLFADSDGSGGLAGATLELTDGAGTTHILTTNDVGNFYTDVPLTLPILAAVEFDGERIVMRTAVDTGACTTCHRCEGPAGGKLFGP